MSYAGSTGCLAGVSSSPGIIRGSPYTSSATDACKSAVNVVRMPRTTRGSASVQFWSVWHMMAAKINNFALLKYLCSFINFIYYYLIHYFGSNLFMDCEISSIGKKTCSANHFLLT
jgi:hypothetical protein